MSKRFILEKSLEKNPSLTRDFVDIDGNVRVLGRVQSHPSRRELRQRLTLALDPLPVEVVESDFDPPNPWQGYRLCLNEIPDGYSHLLIVQDDAICCRNVPQAILRIAARNPRNVVCLYIGGIPMHTRRYLLRAGKEGEHYCAVHRSDWMPVVAVLWPVEKAQHFAKWADRQTPKGPRARPERSDDAMAGKWMRSTRQTVYATIPSIIEHPDDVPSTIGRNPGGRNAMFWHGPDFDALSVEW